MNDSEINDIREQKEFKGTTFSEYKKTDVKKELLNSLCSSKIEPACYWSAELICAGHYSDLWEVILLFYSKYVHIGNPKLSIYLQKRMEDFKDIANGGYYNREIKMRNNPKIRKLFAEIMATLSESKRCHSLNEVKVKDEDFNMTYMTERFKAPNVNFAEEVFKEEDPKEIFIAINELGYNLSKHVRNSVESTYWIEWILEFETICKQKKEKCLCERRTFAKVNDKYQKDLVWIVWDLFLTISKEKTTLIQKVVEATLNIFCFNYTGTSCAKRRKLYLYFMVTLLTQKVDLSTEIVKDKKKVSVIVDNIDNIYKQIKKSERSPSTDYLFTNSKAHNLEKSIMKLEKMNKFESSFIPRTGHDSDNDEDDI